MMGRRSFFSLLGCASAAKAAGIPEPERVESLQKGAIYALYLPADMSPFHYERFASMVSAEAARLGVQFVIFSDNVRLAKLD